MSADELEAARARLSRAQRAYNATSAQHKAATERGDLAAAKAAEADERGDLEEIARAQEAVESLTRAAAAAKHEKLADAIFVAVSQLIERRIDARLASADGAAQFPRHEWDGTRLRFETAPGEWGEWVELRGPRGHQPALPPAIVRLALDLDGGHAIDRTARLDGGDAEREELPAALDGGGAADVGAAGYDGGRAYG